MVYHPGERQLSGARYYDVRTAGDSVNEYPIFYITRTLICPVDYDGAVFKFRSEEHTSELQSQR